MAPEIRISRRDMLKAGTRAAGLLVIGFHLPSGPEDRVTAASRGARFAPNAWLTITSDDEISILVEKPELGQGARTCTGMMVAEELDVDLAAVRVEQAPVVPTIYKHLRTGSSGGVSSMFLPMRRVGAQARQMLIAAAARLWQAHEDDCRADRGAVVHLPTGRRLTYGELVGTASEMAPIAERDIRLKEAKAFRLIGRAAARTDVPEKVDGTARFGIDVRVPGMLFAVVARCPHFGGRLRQFDATDARNVPGVHAVFAIPPLPRHLNTAGGVAVVADSTWAAIQGRRALKLTWDRAAARESTEQLRGVFARQVSAPPSYVAVERGVAAEALGSAVATLEADYESPFQAHATMEPMNTTVHVRDDGTIDVWSPTQFGDEIQGEIAALADVPPERVVVHVTYSGGSFGRRYQWDYAAEAWQVAKGMRQPVQTLWTREDDMRHDFYRPYNYQRLRAGLDADGKIIAWSTRVVTTPIAGSNLYTGYAETPESLDDPAVVAALEWFGADVAPYAIPNVRVDYVPVASVVPRSWWRSVASSYTPFAKESFLDEIAHRIGRDPLQLRLDLLTGSSPDVARLRRVVELAAARAGWGTPLPKRHGRGIACRFGGSCSAQVAEVAVDESGAVRVLRVVSAIDCGIAVNPDGVRAMTEGAIDFALTAVLTGEITIKDSAVEQSNFHDYHVLRFDGAPDVDVQIVPSDAPPSGVGELGAMLIAPAVANAVFAATGVRIRRLPIDKNLLAARAGSDAEPR